MAKAKSKAVEPVPVAVAAIPVPRPRLHKLTISNFRCIGPDPIEIELDDIVVLVGPNNSGKSSILRAYEIVMLHGSDEGKLSKDDFPDGVFDPLNIPTIELETVVFDKTAPGERWVRTDAATGEMFVREKWTWTQPGVPKKVGWDNTIGAWHENECPWGAPNVAQAYRPEPIRVDAFQKPEEQAEKVISLLTKAIEERVKELSKKKSEEAGGGLSIYEKLLDTIKQLRISIAADATAAVGDVQTSFASMLGEVFPGYSVIFDPRPEENVDKSIILYKPNPLLKIGPSGGFQSTIDRQGSGTCRTLIWTALRILAERPVGKTATQAGRAHLLLMDEPEICLHPDAIREACRVLYDLPNTKNWQVMITTHSPVFIDLSRDNTSIARVELLANGKVRGTTIYRPQKARLDDDDRTELKLLNLCDPYVSEFFFGGKTILVEGDTEYTAFKHIVAQDRSKYKNIHIVRARGKACLVSLCKVLNQFNKDYAVLHDADREKVISKKTKAERSNSAWSENQKILTVTETGRTTGHIRLLASVPNFEEAFFGEAVTGDKPYSALARLKTDDATFLKISSLLDCLVDFSAAVPDGAKAWASIDELKVAVTAFDGAKPMPASK